MLTPITHGESQWRRLCKLLGVDPDLATVEMIVVSVRGKPLGQPHGHECPLCGDDKRVCGCGWERSLSE